MAMSPVEVNHRVEGPDDRPPLVLSNSLGTDMRLWDGHVDAFAEHFRVIRYDTRGHGGSPVAPGPYRMADLVDDVVALLDALGIERASFAGVSIGGMVGMALATAAPDRVDRLAVCCTSAHMPPPEMWAERAAVARESGTEPLIEPTLARWFTEPFLANDPAEVKLARDMLLGTPGEGYAGCCEAIAEMDQLESIGAITAPTLIVAGDLDPSTPLPHAEEIRKRIAGSSVVVIPNAAHMAVLEQPEPFQAVVLGHLLEQPRDAG
jgi:3-oxoadipate enol-lactonase